MYNAHQYLIKRQQLGTQSDNKYGIWKFSRKKKKSLLNSILYRIFVRLPFDNSRKFKFFSEMSWLFRRMAFEQAHLDKPDIDYTPYKVRDNFITAYLESDNNVVDLGCGTAEYSRIAAPHVSSVIAVDYDKNILEVAKTLTNDKNVSFLSDEVFSWLSKTDDDYDVVLCAHIIEHLDDPVMFLSDCKKFFKSIYIEVPDNDQDEHSFIREIHGLDPIYNDADHIWEFKRNDLHKIFSDLDFQIIEEQYIHGVMRFWLRC